MHAVACNANIFFFLRGAYPTGRNKGNRKRTGYGRSLKLDLVHKRPIHLRRVVFMFLSRGHSVSLREQRKANEPESEMERRKRKKEEVETCTYTVCARFVRDERARKGREDAAVHSGGSHSDFKYKYVCPPRNTVIPTIKPS